MNTQYLFSFKAEHEIVLFTQTLKALSHWQFFVLHDHATQLLNTVLLSNTIARTCNCCMQGLHKGVINIDEGVINIDELSNTIARTCNCCMQVLHKEVWSILTNWAIHLSNTFPRENTRTIGLRHSRNRKFIEQLCCTNWNSVNSCNTFVQFPLHFHYHPVSGIYPIKDCPIIFWDW